MFTNRKYTSLKEYAVSWIIFLVGVSLSGFGLWLWRDFAGVEGMYFSETFVPIEGLFAAVFVAAFAIIYVKWHYYDLLDFVSGIASYFLVTGFFVWIGHMHGDIAGNHLFNALLAIFVIALLSVFVSRKSSVSPARPVQSMRPVQQQSSRGDFSPLFRALSALINRRMDDLEARLVEIERLANSHTCSECGHCGYSPDYVCPQCGGEIVQVRKPIHVQ